MLYQGLQEEQRKLMQNQECLLKEQVEAHKELRDFKDSHFQEVLVNPEDAKQPKSANSEKKVTVARGMVLVLLSTVALQGMVALQKGQSQEGLLGQEAG